MSTKSFTKALKKRNHATWAYSRARKEQRQLKALENLEKRLREPAMAFETSSMARNNGDLESYKKQLEKEVNTLKQKLGIK